MKHVINSKTPVNPASTTLFNDKERVPNYNVKEESIVDGLIKAFYELGNITEDECARLIQRYHTEGILTL